MDQKLAVDIGNFLFRWRNRLFPLLILALYIVATPAATVFGSKALVSLKDSLALALAAAGLMMRATVIGYKYIKRGGSNKKVYAENLVTDGMFGVCRNPLYVGNILIYSGVFVMHGNPVAIVLGIGFFLFAYHCIVAAEEAYLAEKFGEGYQKYCADVPRWVPDLSRLNASTEGMDFNFMRVLTKDYSTMASTTVALAVTKFYAYAAQPNSMDHIRYYSFLIMVLLMTAGAAAGIRYMKKRSWSKFSA